MQACSLSLEPKCVDVTVIFGRILHTYPNRGTLAPWITTFVLQTGRTSCRICRGRKWAEERWWILTEHDESISSTYLAVLAIMLRAARRFSLLFAPVPIFLHRCVQEVKKSVDQCADHNILGRTANWAKEMGSSLWIRIHLPPLVISSLSTAADNTRCSCGL